MPKHLINSVSSVVDDALAGLLLHAPSLACLSGIDNGIRIVVRRNWLEENLGDAQVALISGGGSGHEPAHGGLVGDGMLTAAVCGDVFASPPTSAVLSAIRAVGGKAGVLLIVKNYTGDRLNFGLAAEQARAEGYRVEVVFVADDIALGTDHRTARGVAGTALVHKIAGHAASTGGTLEQVQKAAQDTADSLSSLSAALGVCSLYGQDHNPRLDSDAEYELGLGIHGEPGVARLPMAPASEIVENMLDELLKARPMQKGSSLALLVNNLGSVPQIEMSLVAGLALKGLQARGLETCLCTVGTIVTALDMRGFSLSLLPLDSEREKALLSVTNSIGWVPMIRPSSKVHSFEAPKASSSTVGEAGPRLSPPVQALLKKAMQALVGYEDELNTLDREVGDGDAGTSFSLGAQRILQNIEGYPTENDPAALCAAIAQSLETSMGGSSGVLMRIALTAAAATLRNDNLSGKSTDEVFLIGLKSGVAAIMKHGGAQKGSRTMVDALLPASEQSTIAEAAVAATDGAKATASMQHATHGRSAYLQHNLNVPDPGALAMARLLAVLAEGQQK